MKKQKRSFVVEINGRKDAQTRGLHRIWANINLKAVSDKIPDQAPAKAEVIAPVRSPAPVGILEDVLGASLERS